ncbi:MAG: molybdopterin cofactor-binding domain-containing protein, partial [Rhodanobacteraceae bacterium]
DPFAFRHKNVLRDGDVGATGQVFQGDVLGPMLDTMARIRNASPARKPLAGNRLYGRATVVGTWFIFVGPATATINLNADGGATLITAGVELGQGTMVQSVPQIVAHELGIDLPVFSVHDCELAVDAETGKVDILAYRVVQDVGRAINPRAIRGQIQGGVTQGIGYALHEELTIGAAGCMQQNTLGVYRVPLAQDTIPVEAELYEGAPWIGPLGVKEAGEIPIMCAPAAIACAVANATGLRVQETPLTPPRVLGLILGREPELTLRHISPDWWDNVFRRRNA